MQMIGQDNDGVDAERMMLFDGPKSSAQLFDMIRQETQSSIMNRDGEEITTTGNAMATVVGHGGGAMGFAGALPILRYNQAAPIRRKGKAQRNPSSSRRTNVSPPSRSQGQGCDPRPAWLSRHPTPRATIHAGFRGLSS